MEERGNEGCGRGGVKWSGRRRADQCVRTTHERQAGERTTDAQITLCLADESAVLQLPHQQQKAEIEWPHDEASLSSNHFPPFHLLSLAMTSSPPPLTRKASQQQQRSRSPMLASVANGRQSISPSFKRHPTVAPSTPTAEAMNGKGSASAAAAGGAGSRSNGAASSSAATEEKEDEKPAVFVRANSYLSSARRANVSEQMSPLRSPARLAPRTSPRGTQRTVDLAVHRAGISPSPLPSPYLTHQSINNHAAAHSLSTSHSLSNFGSVMGGGGSVHLTRPSSTAPLGVSSSSPPSAATLMANFLPPHCYLFEEAWFVLTTPNLLRTRYDSAAAATAASNEAPTSPTLTSASSSPSSASVLSAIPLRSVQVGPLSRNILATMVRNLHVSQGCLVWHADIHLLTGGDGGWQPVSRVQMLQSKQSTSPQGARDRNSLTAALNVPALVASPSNLFSLSASAAGPTSSCSIFQNLDSDPLQSSPLLLHAMLIEELLENEENYLAELQHLLSLVQANSGSGAPSSSPPPSPALLQILRRLSPLLLKLVPVHTTFIAAINSYIRSLYAQIQSLQVYAASVAAAAAATHGQQNQQASIPLPSMVPSLKSLLFSPFLAFLPLEIPRASMGAGGVHIVLEPTVHPAAATAAASASNPAAASASSSAAEQQSNNSDNAREYYQYIFLLAKLLKEFRVFPSATTSQLKPAAAAAAASAPAPSPTTDAATAQMEAVFASLSGAAPYPSSISTAASSSPPNSSSSSSSSSSSASSAAAPVHSIFQHGLTALLSSFHTSLRTRKHKMRLSLAAQSMLSPVGSAGMGAGDGGSSSGTSSLSSGGSGQRSAQRSPNIVDGSVGTFEQQWNGVSAPTAVGAGNGSMSTEGVAAAAEDGVLSLLQQQSAAGWRGSIRNKRASLSSLQQISEGKESAPTKTATLNSTAAAAVSTTTSATRARRSSSSSHASNAANQLGVMTVAEQSLLLRPVYQICCYALILKELISLHSTAPSSSNSGGNSGSANEPSVLVSSLEVENWWGSFHACSFLLAHHLSEENVRLGYLQLFSLERMVFSQPLDEIVVRGRICAPRAKPRRLFRRSGEIGVMFSLNPGASLPPSVMATHHQQQNHPPHHHQHALSSATGVSGGMGSTQIVFFTWFLCSDLLICGKKVSAAAAASSSSSTGLNGLMDSSQQDRERATPCSYQQAWVLDSSFSVRLLEPHRHSSSSLPALELRAGSRTLALYFRSERARSSWMRSIGEAAAESREALNVDSMPLFPLPPTSLSSCLQPLFGSAGLSANTSSSSLRVGRCFSCASFLLPGYRDGVWCNRCAHFVCPSCAVTNPKGAQVQQEEARSRGDSTLFPGVDHSPPSPPSPSSPLLDSSDEDSYFTRAAALSVVASAAGGAEGGTVPTSTEACLCCKPVKQHWPDLSSSQRFPDTLASAVATSVHEGLPQASAVHTASIGDAPVPLSNATAASSSSSSHSKPDGVRRISSSRDSNGREVVSTILGGGIVVLAPVAAAAANPQLSTRRASQSCLFPNTPALALTLSTHNLASPLQSPLGSPSPQSARSAAGGG